MVLKLICGYEAERFGTMGNEYLLWSCALFRDCMSY